MIEMTELEEYQKCLEDIELYRSKRMELEEKATAIRRKIADTLAENQSADISSMRNELDAIELQDEEFGALMHQLTIKRNLLEP